MNLKFAENALKNGITPAFYHRSRKQWGRMTEECLRLRKMNPDSTSIFLDFEGETREVTRALLSSFEEIFE